MSFKYEPRASSSLKGLFTGKREVQPAVEVFKNFSLNLIDGDRLAVRGRNGVGKSTLLKLMAGVFSPYSGVVETSGQVTSLLHVGLGLHPDATGRENITIRSLLMGKTLDECQQVMDEVVDFADLGAFIDYPLRTYSTGMALRLAFATVTAYPASILLMDEWLAVGDADFLEKSTKRIEKLIDDSGILVLASHSDEICQRFCNKEIVLDIN